jgi:integrase
MPATSDIERRDRALLAFIAATGARDSAVASLKLQHIDLVAGSVYQDARQVKTKFRKTFTAFFFPVGDDILNVVVGWVTYLRQEKLWGDDDPVFPSTHMTLGTSWRLEPSGLERKHWSSAAPIRKIFRQAFAHAGLPYFNPHSFRHMLARLGEKLTHSQEEFKAWSENLGHDNVATTFGSYGTVGTQRRGEIIRGSAQTSSTPIANVRELAKALAVALRSTDSRGPLPR